MALMLQLDRVAVEAGRLVVVGDLPAFGPVPSELRSAAADAAARLGAAGLAVGAGLSSWLELFLLRRAVVRRVAPVRLGGGRLPRVLLASLVAVGVGSVLRLLAGQLPAVPAAVVVLVPTGCVYVALSRAMGVPEAGDLLQALRRRTDRNS